MNTFKLGAPKHPWVRSKDFDDIFLDVIIRYSYARNQIANHKVHYLDIICKFEFASNFIVHEDKEGHLDQWTLPYWWHLAI